MIRFTSSVRLIAIVSIVLTAVATWAPPAEAAPKPRDARVGGVRETFEAKYGRPLTDAEAKDEAATKTESNPDVTEARYASGAEAFEEIAASFYKDKLIRVRFGPERDVPLAEDEPETTPDEAHWSEHKATRYAKQFLPRDVRCNKRSIERVGPVRSYTCHSKDAERGLSVRTMHKLEIIGARGDLFYRIYLDDAEKVYRVEVQIGNGLRWYEGDGTIPEARTAFEPARVRIPAIGVDSSIEKTPIVDGVMGIPTDPWAVGWYDQLAMPGDGGNVIMAGHVDWYGIGPVVFWSLSSITEGATVYVTDAEGVGATYRVVSITTVSWDYPAGEVVAPTGVESLTLITCTGEFTGTQYDSRLIVRADRI